MDMKRVVLLSTVMLYATVTLAQQDHPDCSQALVVCSKEPITIYQLENHGDAGEITKTTCYEKDFVKTNSIWLKWKTGTPGTIGFSIIPFDEQDDIDFILYKVDGGLNACNNKKEIRCMVSGENRGGGSLDKPGNKNCLGVTGLSSASEDDKEGPGCGSDQDNFLASIEANSGDVYLLFINNYYSSGGFFLNFFGTAEISPNEEDCQIVESPIVSGSHKTEIVFSTLFPNPTGSEIIIPVLSQKQFDDGTIQIASLQGDIMKSRRLDLKPGRQSIKIDVSKLPLGVYFLKIVVGQTTHIARFSKF